MKDWLKELQRTIGVQAQAGQAKGLDLLDTFEQEIRDPEEGAFSTGFESGWAKGVIVPLDLDALSNLDMTARAYDEALAWAVETMNNLGLHGKHGQRLPPEVWKLVYAQLDTALPSVLRSQLVQAAFHLSKPPKKLAYLSLPKRSYKLTVPTKAQAQDIHPFTAIASLKLYEGKVAAFLAAVQIKGLPFGAEVGRMHVHLGTGAQIGPRSSPAFPIDIRCSWRYIGYGDVWRTAKAVAAHVQEVWQDEG